MSIIFLRFFIYIYIVIFLIELYRSKLNNFSIKNNKIILFTFMDVILSYNAINYSGSDFKYFIAFYYCLRITAFKIKILFIYFYYKIYYSVNFLRTGKLYRFSHRVFFLSRKKKVYIFTLLSFFILMFFVRNVILFMLFVIIFTDINFDKFRCDFDEAFFGKNNDCDIILLKSGKKKLENYLKDLAQTQTNIIFTYRYDTKKSIVLIHNKDFKFKKKIHTQMYLSGCI